MRTIISILIFTIIQFGLLISKVYRVGPQREYKVPSSVMNLVQDRDTVFIDAGLYSGDVGVWRANYLRIVGVGGAYAHLKANGYSAERKAIWVIKGDSNIVENIEFSDCKVEDRNGAGIRLEGTDLIVNHCYFHNNQDGILLGKNLESEVVIRFSEFAYSGYGQGFSHNIYIGNIKKFTMEFCYTHHANKGHTIKSRAEENVIRYNRIMDTWVGVSSMLIDLPNGGNSFIIGNILMQGPKAENSRMITYGKEGLKNKENNLYIVNNTFINYRHIGKFIDVQSGTDYVYMRNNIFAGNAGFIFPKIDSSDCIYYKKIADAHFVNPDSLDYHLTSQSSAIDKGRLLENDKSDLLPIYEYVHPLSYKSRNIENNIDLGAFEFHKATLIHQNNTNRKIKITANPFYDFCKIEGKRILQINIFNTLGDIITSIENGNNQLDILWYPEPSVQSGVYYIQIICNNEIQLKKVIYLK